MISTAQIKRIKSLSQKKFRKELGLFVVEGDKIVREILENPQWQVEQLFALEEWLVSNVMPTGPAVESLTAKELARISSLNTPNQALAVVKMQENKLQTTQLTSILTLLLDNIQDPGNLGTIIRTADWFGIQQVICSENSVEVYNPKVIQASMGSFARVNCYYTDPETFLQKLPANTPVMAALLEGESIYQTELPAQGILITGNESRGISPNLLKYVSHKIHIPMSKPPGKMSFPESLNAAVATGIILSHLHK